MIKVVIAEDERLTRNYLETIIPQLDSRFCVVSAASNGKEALDYIRNNNADVLIADIKMPVMDGLELCEAVNKSYPGILKVIISGYDDFSFAQRAIETNVKEYLLKPIDNQKITGILQKLYTSISNNDALLSSVGTIDSNAWMYAQYYQAMALGLTSQLNACVRIMNRKPEIADFFLAIFSISPEPGFDDRLELFTETLLEYTRSHGAFYFGDANQSVVVLQPVRDRAGLPEALLELVVYLNNKGFSSVLFGVADGNGTESLKTSYHFARANLISNFPQKDYFSRIAMKRDSIGRIFETSVDSEVFSLIDRTILSIESARQFNDYLSMRNEVSRFIQLINTCCFSQSEKTVFLENVISYQFRDLERQSVKTIAELCNDAESAENSISRIIAELQNSDSDAQSNSDITIIEKAKSYILEHFSEPISLIDVAEQVNVAPKYLSNLFVKDAEGSYIKYLTNIRLEVATNMLRTMPSMKLSEVGRAVGYQNDKYFMKVFRKYYGTTPSQYKQTSGDLPD